VSDPESNSRIALICHPDTPAKAVRSIAVEIGLSFDDGFALRFIVDGAIGAVVLPQGEGELVIADGGTDGLWQSTCFEAFLTEEGQPDYTEFNYAPDGRWACYQFDDYRSLLRADQLAPWRMEAERNADCYALRIEPGIFPDKGSKLALSAVIEEVDGTKSYWALCHPPGKPDFHHPDCFRVTLGAPDAA
jgi:hypothetical protein